MAKAGGGVSIKVKVRGGRGCVMGAPAQQLFRVSYRL